MKYSIFLIPATALVFFASCKHEAEAPAENKHFVLSDSMQHMIQIDSVRTCNIGDEIALTGEVSFNENNVVKIFPRSGGQVMQSSLSLGDHVSKGQTLAIIKSADVAGNYSDLAGANADLAIAKRQMDNSESLYKSGISSEREYTEAKQSYEKALAAKNKVQSVININSGGSSSAGGTYVLTSPIDGYIVEKKISVGAFIRPDAADNLFTISDLKNVWVNANVYEADISKVKEGYSVRVEAVAYPGQTFNGRIDKVSEVLDPQTKAMQVRVNIDNPQMLLKPEMFARVFVTNQETGTATCVPSSAIISQDGKDFVVTYVRNDSLEVAQVNIIKKTGDRTYINSGVQPGQRVVTKDQLFIFNQLIEE